MSLKPDSGRGCSVCMSSISASPHRVLRSLGWRIYASRTPFSVAFSPVLQREFT